MDIIFLSSTKGKICSLGFCKPFHYLSALFVFVGIIGLSSYVGYSLGVSPNYDQEISHWKQLISEQKKTLADLQQESDANIDVLSSRIGVIQAHVMRLDALGRRVMDLSNLKGEFDFEEVPAVGGPVSSIESSEGNVQLKYSIQQLSLQLEDREKQLLILEDLLLNNMLASEIKPTGRPITKGWLSSYYGMRTHPISGKKEMHKGIDFAGKLGDPVVSVAKGMVIYAGKKHGYGRVVDVDHGNGYSTRYAHNSKLLVKVGDQVEKYAQIAEIGTSGRSTGPHVHFEVLHKGQQVNPIKYVRASK
ncbi:MAG: M23 family metallopeptidase [Gammaproteobacteria bacterium]|nr:M23 family metallopeptidase [Gammaproteobacteria bacterium]